MTSDEFGNYDTPLDAYNAKQASKGRPGFGPDPDWLRKAEKEMPEVYRCVPDESLGEQADAKKDQGGQA